MDMKNNNTGNTFFAELDLTLVSDEVLATESKNDLSFSLTRQVFDLQDILALFKTPLSNVCTKFLLECIKNFQTQTLLDCNVYSNVFCLLKGYCYCKSNCVQFIIY